MSTRSVISRAAEESSRELFRADVLKGMGLPAKQLPCKYFYDEAGSRLFEEITHLDEYYLTRAELGIMEHNAMSLARLIGPECLLIEYGSGNSSKTRLLLDHLVDPIGYIPIEISEAALRMSVQALAERYPSLEVLPLCADFSRPFLLPRTTRNPRRRVVYFPGSTIGNFQPLEAGSLLRRTAQLCGPGGGMVLGADRKKEPAIIHAAYNDSKGVTAAFNFNLLVRINRELGADFDLRQFWHHASYEPCQGRIEMHLVSRCDQQVKIPGEEFALADGEPILTEYSYKHNRADLETLATRAGFDIERFWSDANHFFSVLCLKVQ
jgi:dimethylhistidine N-methyltransferase